ncbi:signal-transducing adaptor protein 1-like [Rhinoraja longicauda]
MTSTRPAKPSACLVPSYYDGFLEKMENRSQKYKRYWTVLRGNGLFFQVTSRDPMYIEKINLEDFMSVEDDEIYNNNLQHILILKLKSGDIKLKADSLESQVQWKSFIHTVTKLEIPNLILLPGQIWRLREVLEQEIKRRRKLTSSPPPLPPPRDQNYDYVENISCFYKVSRMEAESLLAKNIEFGNLLMRPSSDDRDLSVSTRQAFNKGTIVKHYRIRCVDSGYIIDIDEGVSKLLNNYYLRAAILSPYDSADDETSKMVLNQRAEG